MDKLVVKISYTCRSNWKRSYRCNEDIWTFNYKKKLRFNYNIITINQLFGPPSNLLNIFNFFMVFDLFQLWMDFLCYSASSEISQKTPKGETRVERAIFHSNVKQLKIAYMIEWKTNNKIHVLNSDFIIFYIIYCKW